MNRKTMAYALAGISAISFLSFGTPTFAGYEVVCGGEPLASFQRTVKFQGPSWKQKLSDIHWKGDSSLRMVTEEAITPAGVEDADGLDHYLPQFGTLNKEEGEMGAMTYTLNGEELNVNQGITLYYYHPVLKKLYAIKDITEAKIEDIDLQTSVSKSEAGLVECSLKKDGKNLTSSPVETAKVAETPEGETSKVDTPKAETPIVEEEHTPIVENIPVIAPTPVSEHITHLSDMIYETDKKGYHAIKTQPLFVVVKNFGLDFKKDREALAKRFGIEKYVGSYVQNMQIRNELLKLIIVK